MVQNHPLARTMGRTRSFVKNSRHFAEMMREVKLLEEKLMVSFDVTRLRLLMRLWKLRT